MYNGAPIHPQCDSEDTATHYCFEADKHQWERYALNVSTLESNALSKHNCKTGHNLHNFGRVVPILLCMKQTTCHPTEKTHRQRLIVLVPIPTLWQVVANGPCPSCPQHMGDGCRCHHLKRITKCLAYLCPPLPPCVPPHEVRSYTYTTLPYTKYDIRTYVHADLHSYTYARIPKAGQRHWQYIVYKRTYVWIQHIHTYVRMYSLRSRNSYGSR